MATLLTWVQEQVSAMFSLLTIIKIVTYGHPQAEEKSLNLTKFTEHFNNMSYWTRTIILQQPDAKVVTMIMRTIMMTTMMTIMITASMTTTKTTMLITLISGA